ncbi:MAG: hypothetical protein HC828_19225 [Blastochloris sp.]|nr:hypothetical protein [Blastochloris sp.]
MRIIISRHRLPPAYRWGLALLWPLPITVLMITALAGTQNLAALLDVRFWLPLALMLVPAAYIWREGVDVLTTGLHSRVHIPRAWRYDELAAYRFERDVLRLYDARGRIVAEYRAHLTEFPRLLRAVRANIPAADRFRTPDKSVTA